MKDPVERFKTLVRKKADGQQLMLESDEINDSLVFKLIGPLVTYQIWIDPDASIEMLNDRSEDNLSFTIEQMDKIVAWYKENRPLAVYIKNQLDSEVVEK